MTNIPLTLRLRKKTEKDIAYAQDIIVAELYKFFPDAVFHGGTCIWRCYNGNRFSEDVDFYINKDVNKIKDFFQSLKEKGFKITKARIKENSVYSELDFNSILTRFEATFQNKKAISKRYETSESFFINVYALSSEDLVIEKIQTYLKRRKIRDLYDIYFLINYVEDKKKIEDSLRDLIKNYLPPKDERNLANIIIVGAVPNSDELLMEIRRWAK